MGSTFLLFSYQSGTPGKDGRWKHRSVSLRAEEIHSSWGTAADNHLLHFRAADDARKLMGVKM